MKGQNKRNLDWLKKFSALQIAMFVLTAVLIIASIVTMGVIVDLKNKKDAAKERNDQLSSQLPKDDETNGEFWQHSDDKFIENQNNQWNRKTLIIFSSKTDNKPFESFALATKPANISLDEKTVATLSAQ